ncbi:MAG: tRNA (cytidine(56)-2'-O)-methyltransferase [Methanoculleus sp.]
MPTVAVLRIGHRPERDQRVTTHVGLAARALGAEGMYLAADDSGVIASIDDVVSRWGGDFFAEDGVRWRRCIEDWKTGGGKVVHLTMCGLRMTDVIDEIRDQERVLVVVGAEKVPGDIYGLADYNVSVTSQPHSEISSLALFLDRLFLGKELDREYPDAKIRIEPTATGKRAVER